MISRAALTRVPCSLQIYTLDNDLTEPDYVKTFAKTTLSAGTLLSDTYIVYLLLNSLVVLNGGWSLPLANLSFPWH